MKKKLTKSQKNRMIAGVCGGLAEYFKIDPTIVRLIFVVFALLKGAGILLYLIAAIVIPSQEYFDDDIDSMKSANCNENDTQSKEFSENKKRPGTHLRIPGRISSRIRGTTRIESSSIQHPKYNIQRRTLCMKKIPLLCA